MVFLPNHPRFNQVNVIRNQRKPTQSHETIGGKPYVGSVVDIVNAWVQQNGRSDDHGFLRGVQIHYNHAVVSFTENPFESGAYEVEHLVCHIQSVEIFWVIHSTEPGLLIELQYNLKHSVFFHWFQY